MIVNILFSQTYDAAQKILLLCAFILSALLAISVHEVSHGFAAYKMGDMTAKIQGRLTLNPVAHFDPFGFLMFILVGFGFAKPVPINPYNFDNYRKGLFWVSIAGVLSNLAQALIAFGMLVGFGYLYFTVKVVRAVKLILFFFLYFALYAMLINVALIAFNLLPIYPLDGFHVVESLTPYNNGYVRFMRRYGQYILIAIVGIGFVCERMGFPQGDIFGMYLTWIQNGILDLFYKIIGGLLS